METKRTKAEAETLARKVAIVLRWYFKAKKGKLPNSEHQVKVNKDLVYQILRDEAQMSEEEIDRFMVFISLKLSSAEIKTITGTSIKRHFESD